MDDNPFIDKSGLLAMGKQSTATIQTSHPGSSECDMQSAFDSIAQCINLDDEDERRCHLGTEVVNPFFPGAFGVVGGERSHGRRPSIPDISFEAQPVTKLADNPVTPRVMASQRDSGMVPDVASHSTNGSPNGFLNSPAPSGSAGLSKSFLDDDWLSDRVKRDSKMAQVAGGLVRITPSPPPPLTPNNCKQDMSPMTSGSQICPSLTPRTPLDHDYICRLCNVPGHYIRDCALFQPHHNENGGTSSPGCPSGISSPTNRINGSSMLTVRSHLPPGNYICRLCGVPGHWIEQCSRFQRKKDSTGSLNGPIKPPPDSYICNLCHQPGHWIQQCSEFTPHQKSRRM